MLQRSVQAASAEPEQGANLATVFQCGSIKESASKQMRDTWSGGDRNLKAQVRPGPLRRIWFPLHAGCIMPCCMMYHACVSELLLWGILVPSSSRKVGICQGLGVYRVCTVL